MNMNGMVVQMPMNQTIPMSGKKTDDKSNQGTSNNANSNMQKGPMPVPIMMPMGGSMPPQMGAGSMGANGMPPGMQMFPIGNGMQAMMIPVPMDKVQGQNGANPINMAAMMGGFPMGNSNQNSSTGNPNGGMFGMPSGFIMQVPGQDKNIPMGMMGQKPQ